MLFSPGSERFVAPMMTPWAMQSATIACTILSSSGSFVARSATSSAPQKRPLPRTSPITAWRSIKACRFAIRRSPMATVLASSPSSSMIRMFSMAATGPAVQPPKVEMSRK